MKAEHYAREKEEFIRKQEDDKANKVYEKTKLLARVDFDDFINDKVPVPGDLSMRTSDEKHFCRAQGGMEVDKYEVIIDDLAAYMKLDEHEKKDLQNAKFMDSKVNVMEHNTEGHYAYLRYQILKTPAGKFDFTYAKHTTKFELLTSPTSTKGEIVSSNNQMSENNDKQLTKAHLRYNALTRFEDDCPQQLFTDRSIQDRKEAKMKAKEKEEKEREKEREKADQRGS